MRFRRAFYQIDNWAETYWFVAPWALRIVFNVLYLTLFYVGYLCLVVFFGMLNPEYWHALWTEPNRGGPSLLNILLSIHVTAAAISLIECTLIVWDATLPLRRLRFCCHLLFVFLYWRWSVVVYEMAMVTTDRG